jgi:hypothetical protein
MAFMDQPPLRPGVRLAVDASPADLGVLYCGDGRPEPSIEITWTGCFHAMPGAILVDLCEQASD